MKQIILILCFLSFTQAKSAKGGYLAPCWNSKNCAGNLVCRSEVDAETKMDLRCRRRIKAGKKCWSSSNCENNHICSFLRSQFGKTKMCHKLSKQGELCLSHWHCTDDLVCRAAGGRLECHPKGKVGTICDGTDDCEKKLMCRRKNVTDKKFKCLEKSKKGESCQGSNHCSESLICRATSTDSKQGPFKKCLPKSRKGEFCTGTWDCEEPYKCRGDRLLPKHFCSDRGGDLGDYCENIYPHCDGSGGNTCRRVKPGVYTSCQDYAKNGEYCEEDGHCQGGTKCSIGPLGARKCEYTKKFGEKCWYSEECPPHLTCRDVGPSKSYGNRYCLPLLANGKFCRGDSNCKSNVCLKRSPNEPRVCRDKLTFGSSCDMSNHCDSRLSCRKRGKYDSESFCLSKLSAGKYCEYDEHCMEKHSCLKNVCERTGSEYGQVCKKSTECKGKLVCLNKTCQICRANYDCPSNYFCKAFKCVRN